MVEIQAAGEFVEVRVPGRNERFEKIAGLLGGRRDGDTWRFPIACEKEVRECCTRAFAAQDRRHEQILEEVLRELDNARAFDMATVTERDAIDFLDRIVTRLRSLRERLSARSGRSS